jgi:uncharacterized membrane protein
MTDDEIEEILEQSIADTLGVHSKDVDVTIDPETGDVTYTVTKNDDTEAVDVQDALETQTFLDNLNNEISDSLPFATVDSVDANDDIEMDISVTIDATESTVDIEEANAQVISGFESDGFDGDSETTFVTAKPTVQPIPAPTTSIPSAMPSMTGLIATFEVSKTVTNSLSDSEVDAIEAEVITSFKVSADDITTTVTYSTSGTMSVTSGDLTDEEVIYSIEAALVNELNLHPSDVEVSYDSETGVVTYTITSDDAESLNDVIADMQQPGFEDSLSVDEELTVDSYDAPVDVTATVDITVDASNATDVDSTIDDVTEALQEQDPNAEITGQITFRTSAPTGVPSVAPTQMPVTSIPSAAPSLAGWVATATTTAVTTEAIDESAITDSLPTSQLITVSKRLTSKQPLSTPPVAQWK